METINLISDWITRLMDIPLGFLLVIPRDLAILIVAVGTSLILTLARKWTTNQDQLRRAGTDMARLKQLKREAKRAKDKPAVKRIQATVGLINMMKMKAEGLPLLVSIVPILLLATWAFSRLDYLPPRVGEPVTIRAYYPKMSVDKLTALIPPAGMKFDGCAAIRIVRISGDEMNGEADWTLIPTTPADAAQLIFRHDGEAATHTLTAGRNIYSTPLEFHAGKIEATEVVLTQAKFLGIVPGWNEFFLPPWLVAYLIIVIPFVPLLRKALKVC